MNKKLGFSIIIVTIIIMATLIGVLAMSDSIREAHPFGFNLIINGNPVASHAVEAVLIDNRTYFPLRDISLYLDTSVGWDEETQTVRITRRERRDNVVPDFDFEISEETALIIGTALLQQRFPNSDFETYPFDRFPLEVLDMGGIWRIHQVSSRLEEDGGKVLLGFRTYRIDICKRTGEILGFGE